MRWLFVLGVLASCGRLSFDATTGGALGDGGGTGDGGGSGTGDGGGSGSTDGSTTGACVQPAAFCAFEGVGPCSCWGTPSTINAGMSESGGTLTITPNANTIGAQGACVRNNVAFGPEGIFVEISEVVSGAQGLTALQIGSSPDVFEIDIQNGSINTTDGSNTGGTSYDPVAMRWLRVRPIATGTTFERSADGMTWTGFYTSGRVASAMYNVRIIGGTIGAQAAPGAARFEGINVCP